MARYEEDSKVYGDAGMRIPPRWEHETASLPDDVQKQMAQFKSTLGNPQTLKTMGVGDMLDACHVNMKQLMDRIDVLDQRMNPIMLPTPEVKQEDLRAIKSAFEDSQYVIQIRDLLALIKNGINRVDSIYNRVQL